MTPVEKDASRGFNAEVAAVLRGERAIQRVTYEDLEERTGISRSTIIRVLNAKRMLDLSYLAALCEALGLSMNEVIEKASERAQSEYGNIYGLDNKSDEFALAAKKRERGPEPSEEDYS